MVLVEGLAQLESLYKETWDNDLRQLPRETTLGTNDRSTADSSSKVAGNERS
jgi:hypothetical protein